MLKFMRKSPPPQMQLAPPLAVAPPPRPVCLNVGPLLDAKYIEGVLGAKCPNSRAPPVIPPVTDHKISLSSDDDIVYQAFLVFLYVRTISLILYSTNCQKQSTLLSPPIFPTLIFIFINRYSHCTEKDIPESSPGFPSSHAGPSGPRRIPCGPRGPRPQDCKRKFSHLFWF